MKYRLLAAAGVAALAAAGCSSAHSTTRATSSPTDSGVSSMLAAAADCAAIGGTWDGTTCATPAPTPTASSESGPLGETFTDTTTDINGSQVVYDVTATQVDQHAPLTPYETLDNPNDHLVAVRFTIKGDTGQADDNANNDAVVIGDDTTEYQSGVNSTADGGNFNYGDFKVSPGQTVSGWVTFEVPDGHKVTSVQWQPGGAGSGTATWTV